MKGGAICGKETSSPLPSQRSLVELHNSANSTESPSSGVGLQLERDDAARDGAVGFKKRRRSDAEWEGVRM